MIPAHYKHGGKQHDGLQRVAVESPCVVEVGATLASIGWLDVALVGRRLGRETKARRRSGLANNCCLLHFAHRRAGQANGWTLARSLGPTCYARLENVAERQCRSPSTSSSSSSSSFAHELTHSVASKASRSSLLAPPPFAPLEMATRKQHNKPVLMIDLNLQLMTDL